MFFYCLPLESLKYRHYNCLNDAQLWRKKLNLLLLAKPTNETERKNRFVLFVFFQRFADALDRSERLGAVLLRLFPRAAQSAGDQRRPARPVALRERRFHAADLPKTNQQVSTPVAGRADLRQIKKKTQLVSTSREKSAEETWHVISVFHSLLDLVFWSKPLNPFDSVDVPWD